MKSLVILFVSLLCCIYSNAQKLNVDRFNVKTNDITARTHPRQDINGNDCALIKVQLAAPNAIFDGNVIGDVSYETSIYNVYMSQGSKRLTIRLEGYLPLDVNFEDYDIKPLEAKTVYVMTISGIATTQAIEPVRTKTGWIILDSEPSGASVYINDEFVGNTPLNNYKQAYGTYQYRLEHPNYHSSSGTISLNTGRYEDKIVLKPAFGSVSVKSNVVGAEVLLDGKKTGKKTPCMLSEVASGRHTITLRLNKYSPQQQEVIVEDEQTAQVSVSMDARFASVTINSLESAQIYCNGKLIGTGKCTEDMMEGYYDLEVRLDHHKPVTKQIQVVAGQSQDITLNPTPIYGSLDIISSPRDADITIDGKSCGKTPFTIEQLLEGIHQVTLKLEGYNVENRTLSIHENETASIDVTMSKKIMEETTLNVDEISKNMPETASEKAQSILKEANDLYHKKRKLEEAFRLYREAADLGNSDAMFILASKYYEHGLAVVYDTSIGDSYLAEATKWYKKAADLGNVNAMRSLGDLNENGFYDGSKINYVEAIKWYKKAADLGDVEAMVHLGDLYEEGEGVKKNISEAKKWYMKAADQGYAPAKEALKRLR